MIYPNGTTNSYAGLTMDASGNIYGVTASTVFEVSKDSYGFWNGTVIHTFTGATKDGYYAAGTPALDQAGNLYGTTYQGGARNYGTVYKLSLITKGKNKGKWKQAILHSFSAGNTGTGPNGPWGGVVLDAAGNIYGTTSNGGKYGGGTVFEIVAPVGTGGYKARTLWNFKGSDGDNPRASLVLDSAGNLYGTTYYGGSSGYGVVFEVTP